MADHRVIAFEGIRTPGANGAWTTVDWRTFAGMNPDQRSQVTKAAGMTDDEAKSLDALLAKNKNITWQLGGQSGGIFDVGGADKTWVDKGYSHLSDQLMSEWQNKQDAGHTQDVLNKVNNPNAGATPAASSTDPAATDPNKMYPAYSEQELNAYTNNYVMPIQKMMSGLLAGDMQQWESSVQGIAQATGQQGSPITQLIASQAKQMAPLMQMMGNVTANAQLQAPYLAMVNQAQGRATTEGARLAALGTTGQALQQYGIIDPQTQSNLGLSSGALGNLNGGSALQQIMGASATPGVTGK